MCPITVSTVELGPQCLFIGYQASKLLDSKQDYRLHMLCPFLTQALHDVNHYIYYAKLHISPCCVKIKLLINILSIKQFIIMIFPDEK